MNNYPYIWKCIDKANLCLQKKKQSPIIKIIVSLKLNILAWK